MVKVNNKTTRTRWEIWFNPTITAVEQGQLTNRKISFLLLLSFSLNCEKNFKYVNYWRLFRYYGALNGESVIKWKKSAFYIYQTLDPTHPRSMVVLKPKLNLRSFSVQAKYEVVSLCHCWIMLLTLYEI